jgi:drug/metabolite transporter (DMT)-like permease
MSDAESNDGRIQAPLLSKMRGTQAYRGFGGAKGFWLMFLVLVLLQTADGTLCVLLFDVWGERYSIFINQGGAFVYISWSLLALGMLSRRRNKNSERLPTDVIDVRSPAGSARRVPRRVLILIGLMNGSANFCMAIAQPHTPGLTQTLLLLLGIPLVLVLSWLVLSKRPSAMASVAAALIVTGTGFSGMRTVLQPSGSEPVTVFNWAILLFATAQLFLAAEKIIEESIFGAHPSVHPMEMFCWTLVTQFCLGWALYPLQTIPALGGLNMTELPGVVRDGVRCTVGQPPCTAGHAAVFWAYTCVDFWCYYFGVRFPSPLLSPSALCTLSATLSPSPHLSPSFDHAMRAPHPRDAHDRLDSCPLPPCTSPLHQLWVIQRGGASLLVLVTAVALPLQQLVLCARSLLGSLAETFFWGDAVSLALVLLGFMVFQALSVEGRAARHPANDTAPSHSPHSPHSPHSSPSELPSSPLQWSGGCDEGASLSTSLSRNATDTEPDAPLPAGPLSRRSGSSTHGHATDTP